MRAHAGATPRRYEPRARFHERLGGAVGEGIHKNLVRGGRNEQPNGIGYFLAFKQLGGHLQVFEPGIGATANEGVLNGRAEGCLHVVHVVGRVRERNLGEEFRQIIPQNRIVRGVWVGHNRSPFVGQCQTFGVANTRFCAHFYHHVAERHSAGQGHVFYDFALKLNTLVGGSLDG